MSVSKVTTIWCDWGEAPGNCMKWEQVGASRASDARKQLRRQGWAHKDGQDYCPRHAFGATGDPRHIVSLMRRTPLYEFSPDIILQYIDVEPASLGTALEQLLASGVLIKKGNEFVLKEDSENDRE